jgi:hypothetical protein
MTISPAQYRENSQLRHKWVLSPAGLCDKTIYLGEKRAFRGSREASFIYIRVCARSFEAGEGIGRDSVGL